MSCKNLLRAVALSALLLFSHLAFSQDRVVTGKVTDSKDGSALSGVTVSAKGTRTTTSTAADGSLSISIPGTVRVLVISSVGFAPQEVSVDGVTTVSVSLVLTNPSLGEG